MCALVLCIGIEKYSIRVMEVGWLRLWRVSRFFAAREIEDELMLLLRGRVGSEKCQPEPMEFAHWKSWMQRVFSMTLLDLPL